jgi:hypothetical protein
MQHANWTVDEAIVFTYQNFLSRSPTDGERQLAHEIIGDSLTPPGLSDLLWTVLMLPDFQLIR